MREKRARVYNYLKGRLYHIVFIWKSSLFVLLAFAFIVVHFIVLHRHLECNLTTVESLYPKDQTAFVTPSCTEILYLEARNLVLRTMLSHALTAFLFLSSFLPNFRCLHIKFLTILKPNMSDLPPSLATAPVALAAPGLLDLFVYDLPASTSITAKNLPDASKIEYDSSMLNAYCENHDIIHEVTPPYSPESNRVVERKNRTLKNMVNAMIISFGAPLNLWVEAILSAGHVKNRIPYKKICKTPYEL